MLTPWERVNEYEDTFYANIFEKKKILQNRFSLSYGAQIGFFQKGTKIL